MEGCSIVPIPDLRMEHGDVTLDARFVFSGWAKGVSDDHVPDAVYDDARALQ